MDAVQLNEIFIPFYCFARYFLRRCYVCFLRSLFRSLRSHNNCVTVCISSYFFGSCAQNTHYPVATLRKQKNCKLKHFLTEDETKCQKTTVKEHKLNGNATNIEKRKKKISRKKWCKFSRCNEKSCSRDKSIVDWCVYFAHFYGVCVSTVCVSKILAFVCECGCRVCHTQFINCTAFNRERLTGN